MQPRSHNASPRGKPAAPGTSLGKGLHSFVAFSRLSPILCRPRLRLLAHEDFLNSSTFYGEHLNRDAVELKFIAFVSHAAKVGEDHTAQGIDLFILQADAQRVVEVVHAYRRVDHRL